MMRTGADLLAAVAEEVQTHVARTQRGPAAEALIAQADDVLAAIGAVLTVALAAPASTLSEWSQYRLSTVSVRS
jgi:hypothetical protein